MYIVEEGKFDVLSKGKKLNELHRGSDFGELALLHGIPRIATVVATQKSKVWSEQTSFSCIRIRDKMYSCTVASEAVDKDEILMKIIKTPQNLEKIIDDYNYKSSFISAGTPHNLEELCLNICQDH